MSLLYQEIKRSYRAPLVIFVLAAVIMFGLKSRIGIFESSTVFDVLIFVLPLSACIASFAVSKRYGRSKVFGRSYFLLGCGFFATFLGEFLYFLYGTALEESVLDLFDNLFLVSFVFTAAHMIINIRYFAERFEFYQKAILVFLPVFIVAVYSYLVYLNSLELNYGFFFNLVFVCAAAINLGLVVVGFSLFRHTVLFSAWFLLLVGFFIGTLGDLEYRYYNTFGADFLGNNSTVFWLTSFMILVYALYKHQKSM